MCQYCEIITSERPGHSSQDYPDITYNTISDRSRIVYSSPFRRLQQKAQVFSLEGNPSVRSRLTHSMEVADCAKKIGHELIKKDLVCQEIKDAFLNQIETTCLMHDIGNPPFGHFGEEAIKKWFSKNWKDCFRKSIRENNGEEKDFGGAIDNLKNYYIKDFFYFDGNPQGFRIASFLQEPFEKEEYEGFNLTYSQLWAFLKYVESADELKHAKKPGIFYSEKEIFRKLKENLNITNKRSPISFIMEAADDISYCISDIEDGVEKEIIDIRAFFENLEAEWRKLTNRKDLESFPGYEKINQKDGWEKQFFEFKINFTNHLIKKAASVYSEKHENVLNGTLKEIFDERTIQEEFLEEKALEALKSFSRKELYRSKEAEDTELGGYELIYGLLEKFGILLELPKDQFSKLLKAKHDPDALKGERLDVEWRLFNKIPSKFVGGYKFQTKNLSSDHLQEEWFHRAHLIVDYIAGMTDHFALETYQLLKGVRIK